jgi:hypothetical protein
MDKVISLSKWLHSQQGKKFLAYTYPKLKSFTRKYVNLGIYEYLEKVYWKVDEHWHGGDMEPVPELKPEGYSLPTLPNFEDIYDEKRFNMSRDQGKTNRCTLYTTENQIKDHMYLQGITPPDRIIDTQLLYSQVAYKDGDNGVVYPELIEHVQDNGVPINTYDEDTEAGSWTRYMQNYSQYKAGLDYAMPWHKGTNSENYRIAATYDDAAYLDSILGDEWVARMSIRGVEWFGKSKPDGTPNPRTGGHSIALMRGTFSVDQDNDEVVAVHESARYSSEPPYRTPTKALLDSPHVYVSFQRVHLGNISALPSPTVKVDKYPLLSQKDIRFGSRGEAVVQLQSFLEDEGFFTYKGEKGYFGQVTAKALREWLKAKTSRTYSGRYWGSISRKLYVQAQ